MLLTFLVKSDGLTLRSCHEPVYMYHPAHVVMMVLARQPTVPIETTKEDCQEAGRQKGPLCVCVSVQISKAMYSHCQHKEQRRRCGPFVVLGPDSASWSADGGVYAFHRIEFRPTIRGLPSQRAPLCSRLLSPKRAFIPLPGYSIHPSI